MQVDASKIFLASYGFCDFAYEYFFHNFWMYFDFLYFSGLYPPVWRKEQITWFYKQDWKIRCDSKDDFQYSVQPELLITL